MSNLEKKHMNEAKEFMIKFLKTAKINNSMPYLEHYSEKSGDNYASADITHVLPQLKGIIRRDITLGYFPDDNQEGIYGDILYRNIIASSETPNILEFCNNSKILRAMIPVVKNHLGMMEVHYIPKRVLDRNPDYAIKQFQIIDHMSHASKKRRGYCAAISMSVTPEDWKMQAKVIGGIEKHIRQYANNPKKIEKLDIKSITLI
jgi:hypothetical protein